MRKKLRLAAGLVAVLLAIVSPPFTLWSMYSNEPPLYAGMEEAQVNAILGHGRLNWGVDFPNEQYGLSYTSKTDWTGVKRVVTVLFSKDRKVVCWESAPLPRTRPPWLDRIAKWVGW
jgi:hypothetical protein